MALGRVAVALGVLMVAVTIWTACGSTDPLAGGEGVPEAVVRYQSGPITVRTAGDRPRLTVEAVIGCASLPCDPQSGTLTFVSHRNRSIYRDERALLIAAGGIRISYPGAVYDEPRYELRDLSERITVPVAVDELREIARADSVYGQLGPTRWSIPYDRRRALRSMMRQIGT